MKKHFILIFLCSFSLHTPVFTQSTNDCNTDELLSEKQANEIASKIYRLFGGTKKCTNFDQFKGCPEVFYDNDPAIATFTGCSDWRIRISKNAIEKLRKFGCNADDCLAVIIAHELWHAVNNHSSANYGSGGKNGERSKEELESDLYGLLGAHLSGYSAAIQGYDALQDAILNDSPNGGIHPGKVDRKKNNDTIIAKLNAVLPLYKVGTYNLLMGGASELGRAEACFKAANARLENGNEGLEFPQFNYQLGVVNFSRALLAYGQPWVFPLEAYDASFLTPKLRGGGDGTTDPVQLKISLDASDRYFQKILHINPNHWDARLGMACVATLRVAIDGNIPTANQTIAQLVADLNTELNKFPTPQKAEWEKKHVLTLKEMKDKAALLQFLIPIIPEKPADAVKKKASTDLEQLRGTTTWGFAAVNIRLLAGNAKDNPSTQVLSLPERDGLNKNTKQDIYEITIRKTAPYNPHGIINAGDKLLPLATYQPTSYKNSTLLILGEGSDAYIFQEYRGCPLTIGDINAAGGGLGKPGTGEYRYFHNEKDGYEVIVELSPDGKKIDSCVKVFKSN